MNFDETLKAEITIQTALFQSLGKSQLVPDIVIGNTKNSQQANGSEFMRLLAAEAALSFKERLKK